MRVADPRRTAGEKTPPGKGSLALAAEQNNRFRLTGTEPKDAVVLAVPQIVRRRPLGERISSAIWSQ